jgi:hypothetical protein
MPTLYIDPASFFATMDIQNYVLSDVHVFLDASPAQDDFCVSRFRFLDKLEPSTAFNAIENTDFDTATVDDDGDLDLRREKPEIHYSTFDRFSLLFEIPNSLSFRLSHNKTQEGDEHS